MSHSIQPEDWNSHSHQSIYDTAHAFDTGKPTTAATAFHDAGTNLHEEATVMGQQIQQIVGDRWRGVAAQSMQTAYNEFFQDVDGYVKDMLKVANALPAVGSAMGTAKSSIEPPKDYGVGTIPITQDPALAQAIKNQQKQDEQYARWQMTNLFSQPAVDAGKNADINDNGTAQNTGGNYTQPASTGTGSGTSGSNSGSSNGKSKDASNTGQTRAAFDQGSSDGQQSGQGQGQGSGQGGQGSGGQGSGSGGSGSGSPGSGLGSGLGSGSGGSGSGLPYGATTAAGYSPSATGTGTGSPTAGSAPGALRGVPGLPGGVAGGTNGPGGNPAGIGAAGVRGGPGGFGMGGLGGAHARGKGDEEEDHQIPSILINAGNGQDLFGDDRKVVPGGVIGDFQAIEDAEKQRREAEKRRYKSMGWDVRFSDEDK